MRWFAEGSLLVGFSERQDGDLGWINQSTSEFQANWTRLTAARAPDLELPGFAHQVHGTDLIEVTDKTRVGLQGKADALATDLPNRPLGVFSADCLPVLVGGPTVIAAIHAGWRSTRGNIVGRVITRLQERYALAAADLHVFMGPCIGPCCLEMGEEVPPQFLSENPAYASCFTRGSKWHLDLRALNVLQCRDVGIPWNRIHHVNDCTKCLSTAYFSYRGDGGRNGSLFSIIARRPAA